MAPVNWRSSPKFYIVPEKMQAGRKPIQTPVPLHPAAGQNPDWLIKATFHLRTSIREQCAMGKIQRNNYHHGNCQPSLAGKMMSLF